MLRTTIKELWITTLWNLKVHAGFATLFLTKEFINLVRKYLKAELELAFVVKGRQSSQCHEF